MGIELNPRIGDNFDLKLYTNGRPGLIAWTLVSVFLFYRDSLTPAKNVSRDLSNIAYHYQIHRHTSPSLILVTILHGIYVLDFFINEAWYLRTIDIAHDHYGFYLAWGCLTWVPSMYTLQTQFLGLYPTSASPVFLILIFSIGIAGLCIVPIRQRPERSRAAFRRESPGVGQTRRVHRREVQDVGWC